MQKIQIFLLLSITPNIYCSNELSENFIKFIKPILSFFRKNNNNNINNNNINNNNIKEKKIKNDNKKISSFKEWSISVKYAPKKLEIPKEEKNIFQRK